MGRYGDPTNPLLISQVLLTPQNASFRASALHVLEPTMSLLCRDLRHVSLLGDQMSLERVCLYDD